MKLFQKIYQAIDKFLQKESNKSCGCGCGCAEEPKITGNKNKDSKKCCKD